MNNERKQSKLDELIQQYCPDGVEHKPVVYETEPSYQMVAEESAPYGAKEN